MASGGHSVFYNNLTINKSRRGGMADAPDLKSVVRKGVRVRVPPTAPSFITLKFKRLRDFTALRFCWR